MPFLICFGQTPPTGCGTDQFNQARPSAPSGTATQLLTNSIIDDSTPYTIPVVFIVYHLGEPVGQGSNLSDEILLQHFSELNKAYKDNSAAYPGPDSHLQFERVRRTPACQPTNGIIRVDARSVAGYEKNGIQNFDPVMLNSLQQLVPEFSTQRASDGYVAINIVHKLDYSGFAAYGGSAFISINALTYDNQNNDFTTISHEVGHVLYLLHTFQGVHQIPLHAPQSEF